MFLEAGGGPSLHRVLPAGLYVQRDSAGHRQTPQLPTERRPYVHVSRGSEM